MPEKEIAANFSWFSAELWSIIGLSILGWTYRTLVSETPFVWKKFAAEGVGAIISGIIIYSAGLMHGMTPAQMVFTGAMGGLGTIRVIENTLKILRDLKVKP